MKKIAIILLACATSVIAGAQTDFDPALKAYMDFCLLEHEALSETPFSKTKLERCIEECDTENFAFNGQTIKMSSLSTFSNVDTEPHISTEGHTLFMPDYIDSLLTGQSVLDNPLVLRGSTAECYSTHCALEPKAKGTYTMMGANDMQMFAIAEPGTLIRITVSSKAEGFDNSYVDDFSEPFSYVAEATNDSPACTLRWTMPHPGTFFITIENLSSKPTSFVIATN